MSALVYTRAHCRSFLSRLYAACCQVRVWRSGSARAYKDEGHMFGPGCDAFTRLLSSFWFEVFFLVRLKHLIDNMFESLKDDKVGHLKTTCSRSGIKVTTQEKVVD